MMGLREIQRLRGVAAAALGERFDLGAFHATVLDSGSVPLTTLGFMVERFIAVG